KLIIINYSSLFFCITPPGDSLMSIQDPHVSLLNSDEFKRITAKKHRISVILFCITMAMFFAIPLLSHFAPEFQKRSLVGSMNIGLGFILFQYAAGSVIAII